MPKPNHKPPDTTKKGHLKVVAWSAFSYEPAGPFDSDRKSRWTAAPSAESGVPKATLSLGTRKSQTDNDSTATLDLTGQLNGFYTVRLDPPKRWLGIVKAGPALVPPTEKGEDGKVLSVDRLFRPIEISFGWKNDALDPTVSVLVKVAPSAVDEPGHGYVMSATARTIHVDWRPDFLRVETKPRPTGAEITTVVLHRTAEEKIGSSLEEFLKSNRAAHYLVDADGFVVKLAPEEQRTNHAGPSHWKGQGSVGDVAIGIETANATGLPQKPDQIKAVVSLVLSLLQKYPKIHPVRVLGHCEVRDLEVGGKGKNEYPVNPKVNCPGIEFDWPKLEKAGAAHPPYGMKGKEGKQIDENKAVSSYQFFADNPGAVLKLGDQDAPPRYGLLSAKDAKKYAGLIREIQKDLARIGYERVPFLSTNVTHLKVGKYNEAMLRVVQRFQARYLAQRGMVLKSTTKPPEPSGEIDQHTAEMIQRVLANRIYL